VPWAIWFNYAPELLLKDSKGKWRATLLPAWTPGGARSGTMGGSSFVIPKQAKNPYLAWLVFEHLCFTDAGVASVYGPNEIYPGGINTSIPSYLPALDPAKPLFKPGEGLGGQNLWEVATEAGKQIPGATPLPAWWGQAVDYLGANLQRLMNAEMSVDDVIARSSEDIQRNLVDRA
jgi:lactose/L-arabinose transport system substrate-binding protein